MSKYIKEDLEVMLRNHKKNEAKLTELDLKQEEYQESLKYAGTVYQSEKEEIIENMQFSGRGYDNIHSATNKISDKVFTTAVNYGKEESYINKADREDLERKIAKCEIEKGQLNKDVVRVKNLLEQLTEEENFVVVTYYMRRAKWDYVEEAYDDKFEVHKSIKQLQTYRDNALNSMLEILNTGT